MRGGGREGGKKERKQTRKGKFDFRDTGTIETTTASGYYYHYYYYYYYYYYNFLREKNE